MGLQGARCLGFCKGSQGPSGLEARNLRIGSWVHQIVIDYVGTQKEY